MRTNTEKTVDDFKVGQRVRYIPNHAYNQLDHEDVEHGIVTSRNKHYVFVRFQNDGKGGVACNPSNLL